MSLKKLVGFETLLEIVKNLKKEGKKIVYAHGAFDLLHTGHIHHLEEAKKLGDVLIVTITADRFIKRGAGRPRFKQEERARFVAALECVNYVSISDSADCADAINLLQPDFYAKGEDVKEKADDLKEGLYREIKALEDCGGEIKFLESLPIHSTELLNEFFNIYPSHVKDFLKEFRKKYSFEMILETLQKIKKLKVLAIGDAIIDVYQYVSVMSKSPKSNHITTWGLSEEEFAGGVMACANHLAGFCEKVDLVTCLGSQNSKEEFIRANLGKNIQPQFFYRHDAPTTLKKRFVEPAYLTKMFEIYHFNDADLLPELKKELRQYLESRINEYDIVLVADYGHGFLAEEIINLLCERAKFLAVNVQTNSANYGFNLITKYPRADYICIDEAEIRLATHSRLGRLELLARKIGEKTQSNKISITCGHHGCMTFSQTEGFSQIPVLSTKVVDTIGAGDAFFSVSSPWAVLGLPMELVGFIGNVAGAIKVGTLCNKSAVGANQLKDFIERLLAGRN